MRQRGDHQGTRGVSAGGDRTGVDERGGSKIGCRARELVIDMDDAVPDQDARPQRTRRLSDHLLSVFHADCDQGDLDVAEQLIVILEHMQRRPPPVGRPERRINSRPLIAAHERLWCLRHPEAREQ